VVIFLSNQNDYKEVENKLLLLYLIDKMDLPLSRSQITDYVREAEFMDYFTLSQTLSEMVEGGFLENTVDNNTTRYSITGDGQTMLEYFEKHIPLPIRTMINSYVHNNRRNIKKEYEVTATYFPNAENDEFVVKCGVYEDERTLMELAISVDTRDQAKLIQANWKTSAKHLYGRIIEALISP
jgi:DNA-binding HxlR family transcriptional regulator